jgi:quercetin dioxygenase-like cupin family protein
MFAFVRLDPHAEVPSHAHDNEQTGTVVEGSLRFTIGEETREVGRGEAYLIPPDVPHAAIAGTEGSLVVEIFVPPRQAYRMPATG